MSAHRWLATILSPLLILLLAACSDAEEELQQTTQSPPPTVAPTQMPTPSPSATLTPTTWPADVPADWDTYTDAEFGFSLRYPPDLTPSGPASDGGFVERAIEFRSSQEKSRIVTISVSANPEGLALSEWAVEFAACRMNSIEETVLSGLPAIACTREVIESVLEPAVLAEEGGKIFLVSAIGLSDLEFSLLTASISIQPHGDGRDGVGVSQNGAWLRYSPSAAASTVNATRMPAV